MTTTKLDIQPSDMLLIIANHCKDVRGHIENPPLVDMEVNGMIEKRQQISVEGIQRDLARALNFATALVDIANKQREINAAASQVPEGNGAEAN